MINKIRSEGPGKKLRYWKSGD